MNEFLEYFSGDTIPSSLFISFKQSDLWDITEDDQQIDLKKIRQS